MSFNKILFGNSAYSVCYQIPAVNTTKMSFISNLGHKYRLSLNLLKKIQNEIININLQQFLRHKITNRKYVVHSITLYN